MVGSDLGLGGLLVNAQLSLKVDSYFQCGVSVTVIRIGTTIFHVADQRIIGRTWPQSGRVSASSLIYIVDLKGGAKDSENVSDFIRDFDT